MKEWTNLNDLEYGNQISRILRAQSKLNHLSAERRYAALTDTLAEIEDAARKANWRIQELSK